MRSSSTKTFSVEIELAALRSAMWLDCLQSWYQLLLTVTAHSMANPKFRLVNGFAICKTDLI
jgi:hypothetical protein